MNPTKVEDVKRVSEAGLLMPQKSTYFYPKLLSGLVINPFGVKAMTAGSCKRKPGPVEAPAPGHSRQAARVAEKTPEKIGAYEFRQAGQRLTQDSVLLADFVLPLKKKTSCSTSAREAA